MQILIYWLIYCVLWNLSERRQWCLVLNNCFSLLNAKIFLSSCYKNAEWSLYSHFVHIFQAVNIHPDLDESIDATKEALSDITNSLDHFTGVVNTFVASITKSMQQIPDPNQPNGHYASDYVDSYVNYHTRMVGSSKEIARISQEMVRTYFESSHFLKHNLNSIVFSQL